MKNELDTSWLDDPTTVAEKIAAPAVKELLPVRSRPRGERYALTVRALRRTAPVKRVFLKCLQRNNWQWHPAYNEFKLMGYESPKKRTVYRWREDTDFLDTVKMLQGLALTASDLETHPTAVLARVNEIANHGMEQVPKFDREGRSIGIEMRDPGAALTALTQIGKNKKMWGGEEVSTRVVLDFVNLTGRRSEVIDAEVVEAEFDETANQPAEG